MGQISSQVTDISVPKTEISVTGLARLLISTLTNQLTQPVDHRMRFCAFFAFFFIASEQTPWKTPTTQVRFDRALMTD